MEVCGGARRKQQSSRISFTAFSCKTCLFGEAPVADLRLQGDSCRGERSPTSRAAAAHLNFERTSRDPEGLEKGDGGTGNLPRWKTQPQTPQRLFGKMFASSYRVKLKAAAARETRGIWVGGWRSSSKRKERPFHQHFNRSSNQRPSGSPAPLEGPTQQDIGSPPSGLHWCPSH
ncbi:hypothetical protein GN956_G25393 [Arapaima gigas]